MIRNGLTVCLLIVGFAVASALAPVSAADEYDNSPVANSDNKIMVIVSGFSS